MSVPLVEVIVKLVPAVRADTRSAPGVPPVFCAVRKIRLLAVTAVVLTVIEPAVMAAVMPIFLFVPSSIFRPVVDSKPVPFGVIRASILVSDPSTERIGAKGEALPVML